MCKKGWDRATEKELERENILLPQSASLTAPSKKEPVIALSDRFIIALSVSLCSTALLAADGNPLSASQTSPFQGSTRSESREDVFFKGVFKGELGRSFSFKDYFSVVRSIALKKV